MPWQTKVFDLARERGWTLRKLGAEMRYDFTALSRIQRGERTPSTLEFREGLKRAFPDCDPDDLLWFEPEPEKQAR